MVNIYQVAAQFKERLTIAFESSPLYTKRQIFSPQDAWLVRQAYERELAINTQSDADLADDTRQLIIDEDTEEFINQYTTLGANLSPSTASMLSCSLGSANPLKTPPFDTTCLSEASTSPGPSEAFPCLDVRSVGSVSHAKLNDPVSVPTTSLVSGSPLSDDSLPPKRTRGRKNRTNDGLDELVLEKRDEDGRYFECVVCGHTAPRRYDVKRHVTSHNVVDDPHVCLGCGARFKRTDARVRHWSKNPECELLDDLASRNDKKYKSRHGRRNPRLVAETVGMHVVAN
ncbi:uncharacterized protein FOMMEDRAFT_133480 [Fomitiporia mediterranea MF3/22]|uniref:uncharacterized protein n=1 Tax=Fomitiporia mediterranea (strain MF3/22) TaxID=694068 RepID=UPI0004408BBB|nr:uncharacterized protein FOMMEDRAFT_133480 [Fomitiporia mediterranea MF3/22]EJD04153.1 hypothetical protein FOMMEDRAFT_133480 [Fomitiporia mediterranea MF3/22]